MRNHDGVNSATKIFIDSEIAKPYYRTTQDGAAYRTVRFEVKEEKCQQGEQQQQPHSTNFNARTSLLQAFHKKTGDQD